VAVVGAGVYHVFMGWMWPWWVSCWVSGAAQNSSSKATGLDEAMRTLREQPEGPWLLSAVDLGIAAYGVYSFARAKHARI
jgi:hypothetical protein